MFFLLDEITDFNLGKTRIVPVSDFHPKRISSFIASGDKLADFFQNLFVLSQVLPLDPGQAIQRREQGKITVWKYMAVL